VTVAGTTLDECLQCGGLWVSAGGLVQICSDPAAQAAAEALKLPPAVEVSAKRYVNCPQCSSPMSPMNYAGASGVIVHYCRDHGIWLDRDEMRQIVEFMRGGGLEHMQKMRQVRAHDQEVSSWAEQDIQTDVFHSLATTLLPRV
jgi:Zn-finger nucleic acid-binding protein